MRIFAAVTAPVTEQFRAPADQIVCRRCRHPLPTISQLHEFHTSTSRKLTTSPSQISAKLCGFSGRTLVDVRTCRHYSRAADAVNYAVDSGSTVTLSLLEAHYRHLCRTQEAATRVVFSLRKQDQSPGGRARIARHPGAFNAGHFLRIL